MKSPRSATAPSKKPKRGADSSTPTRVYDSIETMLERERLDFIDILTPPALHSEHCLAARRAGVHIICQKPLCDSLDDARQLVATMADYLKLFTVHENHRYRPWFRRIIQSFREGFFGAPHFLRLEHHNPTEPAESYKLETDQGILLEYGTHLVDMMRALLGEPRRVYATTHNLNPKVKGESLAHVVYEYPQTTAVVDIAWKSSGLLQGGVLLEGEEGEAYYEGTMTRGERARFRLLRHGETTVDDIRSPYEDYVESFYLLERECVDAMLTGGQATQTGAENLKTLEVTFAAYEAARANSVVEISDAIF